LSLMVSLMVAAVAEAQSNPNAIAQLRWYEFNKVAQVTVLPAIHSEGIAFDGGNMWVTGFFENTVTKIRASDMAILGTFKVGSFPSAVAFDGVNIWVSNGGSGT
jgi:DNA-binding beta-propeller fold protein YncE